MPTDTTEQLPIVDPPKHPLHAMTTYELRDYRRELECAITFYDQHRPAAPAPADLKDNLDKVQAEEESRKRIADA